MRGQLGGGRELQEATSYKVLHALRFPIVGGLITLLAVFSVILSLTGPTEPDDLEGAYSQIEPVSEEVNSSVDMNSSEGPTQSAVVSSTLSTKLDPQKTQNRYNEVLRSENTVLNSYTPNFVPRGELTESITSFSPVTVQNPTPIESSPNQPPPSQSPPPGNSTFVPAVEQWRQAVESAISAYGGPSSDTDRFLRVMQCESMGQPDATNASSGAAGLMQHLPQYWDQRASSAGYSGYSPYDPIANINVSSWLIYQAAGGGWRHWVCQ